MMNAPRMKLMVRRAFRARFSDLLFFRVSDLIPGVEEEEAPSEDLHLLLDLPPPTLEHPPPPDLDLLLPSPVR